MSSLSFSENNGEQAWQFINSTYQLTNLSSVGDRIVESDTVPPGYSGVLRDLSVVFTTAGGAVDYEIKTSGGSSIKFFANVSTTTSGQASMVLGPGERFRLTIGTAGAGVIHVSWHGYLKPLGSPRQIYQSVPVSLPGRGGF